MPAPDPTRHRRIVDAARQGLASPDRRGEVVSGDVRASWQRCERTLPTRATAPVELADPRDAWAHSPIRVAAGGLVDELAALATREDYVAAITDPLGRILWSSAGRDMVRRAERASFVCGANWNERLAGTNAPGLVLETGRPAAVFATEHWCDSVRDWVCYAAPVRDTSGSVVGVLDLSSHWRRANPLALTFITSMARLMEHELAVRAPRATAPLRVQVLGSPRVLLNGTDVHMTNRRLEILTILARHDGLRLGELHALLYGDRDVAEATLKAEISHLRRALDGAIDSRPYRLTLPVELDVTTVLDAVARGDLEQAMQHYHGALLPQSDSPYLVDLRHHLEAILADVVLAAGGVAHLERYAAHNPGDVRVTDRIVTLQQARRRSR